MPDEITHSFRRERIPSRDKNVLVVRSTCKKCGESMVLDIRDGLDEAESAHHKKCDGKVELINSRHRLRRE